MDINKQMIEDIIREVLREECGGQKPDGRQIDPSGVIGIDPDKLKLEQFPFPIGTDRVLLVDAVSLEESPRLGIGVMEMDHTSFEWTLTYDEFDYVVEGTLEIIIDGRPVTAKAGQIIFIPKNTHITFSTPDKTRFIYVCYPANWSEQ